MEKIMATRMIGGNPDTTRSSTDFYPTPAEVTKALLAFLEIQKPALILEPACGQGDMVNVMREAGYSVYATDLIYGHDFLTDPLRECDWIITNPPFSVSDKFIKRCAAHGKPFALLLKSQYWHAKKRIELFQEITPKYVLPLTWRPDFLFKKHVKRRAPLMDVMWCVWEPPYNQNSIYKPLARPE